MKNIQQKKHTVCIAIPAYNEEQSIGTMLQSVLNQRHDTFILEKIAVYCDDPTDNTIEIVKSLAKNNPIISVYVSPIRMGKSATLNKIFTHESSDICVLLDADIILANTDCIAHLVTPFHNDQVGLTSGNDTPINQPGFFAKITSTTHELWYEIRKNIHNGDSIHNIHGPIYALTKKLYKLCTIPSSLNLDDHFVYLLAKHHGFTHIFAKSAIIYYKIPSTILDYFRQHSRYIGGFEILAQYFGAASSTAYNVPKKNTVEGFKTMLLKKPFLTLCAIALQVTLRIVRPFFLVKHDTGKWDTIKSSKNINRMILYKTL